MTNVPSYPFVPKSNVQLAPGQFWSIPLSDGRFATLNQMQCVP